MILGSDYDHRSDQEQADLIASYLEKKSEFMKPKKLNRRDLLFFLIYLIVQVFSCGLILSLLTSLPPGSLPGMQSLLVGIAGGLLVAAPFVIYLVYLTRRFVPSNPVPSRKKPLSKLRDELIPLLITVVVTNGLILFERFAGQLLGYQIDEAEWFGLFVILLAITIFLMLVYLLRIIRSIYYRSLMERSPGNVIGTILDLHINQMVSSLDERMNKTTSHEFTIRYTPKLARNAPRDLIFRGKVNKKFWRQLRVGQEIPVRYSTDDPSIFFIEGE